MSTGVERWAELRDREAVGDPVSAEELKECDVLEASDPLVRAQAAPFRELSRMLDRASMERATTTDRDIVDRALLAVRVTSGRAVPGSTDADAEIERAVDPEGPRWIRASAVAISLILPAAAAIALIMYEPKPVPSAEPVTRPIVEPLIAPTVVPIVHARTAGRGQRLFRAGSVLPFNTELVEGDSVESGTTPGCLVVDPGVDVCLAANTGIKLVSLSRTGRALEVLRGHAVARLDPQAPGDGFELRADAIRAQAEGTVYGLERVGDTEIRVRVLEGHVKVLAADSALNVESSQVAVYRNTERTLVVEPLLPMHAARALEVLAARNQEPIKPAAVEGAPAPAAPVATRPEAGAKQPAVAAAATAPQTDARARLREAWEQLKSKRWADAAATYAAILKDFPKSDEAHVVLVRLGDLQLDHLDQPGQALASYERYLREGGGPLEAEARYGRIQALARLGRTGSERGAIEDFLTKHPTSLKAPTLRERLLTLPR